MTAAVSLSKTSVGSSRRKGFAPFFPSTRISQGSDEPSFATAWTRLGSIRWARIEQMRSASRSGRWQMHSRPPVLRSFPAAAQTPSSVQASSWRAIWWGARRFVGRVAGDKVESVKGELPF